MAPKAMKRVSRVTAKTPGAIKKEKAMMTAKTHFAMKTSAIKTSVATQTDARKNTKNSFTSKDEKKWKYPYVSEETVGGVTFLKEHCLEGIWDDKQNGLFHEYWIIHWTQKFSKEGKQKMAELIAKGLLKEQLANNRRLTDGGFRDRRFRQALFLQEGPARPRPPQNPRLSGRVGSVGGKRAFRKHQSRKKLSASGWKK